MTKITTTTTKNINENAPKLTLKDKEDILQASSEFTSLKVLADRFGVSRQNILYYQKQYKREIATLRKTWLKRLADEPFANKRFRIRALQDLYDKAIELYFADNVSESSQVRLLSRMESLLNSSRIELEGSKLTISGTITHEYDEATLIDKAQQILGLKGIKANYKTSD